MKIGNVEIKPNLALAPMAGVSDIAFRTICRNQGAGIAYSEMVSAKALCFGDKKSHKLLTKEDTQGAYAVQIFGSDEKSMAEGAKIAADMSGADILDINMGCPVGKVVRSGDGSALMRDADKAARIIAAVKRAVSIPVTVKFRKGWDKGSVNAAEFARAAQAAGADGIAVHGRTRVQMYSGVADWDIIREVKRAVSIPVFANGDVFCGDDARRILNYTGADGVMIGRGSFGNPWIFRDALAAINGDIIPPEPTVSEKVDMALLQAHLTALDKGEKIACLEMRKCFNWYLKGVPHSSGYRAMIVKVSEMRELERIAAEIKDAYK